MCWGAVVTPYKHILLSAIDSVVADWLPLPRPPWPSSLCPVGWPPMLYSQPHIMNVQKELAVFISNQQWRKWGKVVNCRTFLFPMLWFLHPDTEKYAKQFSSRIRNCKWHSHGPMLLAFLSNNVCFSPPSYFKNHLEGGSGRNWEIGIDTYTPLILCIK